MIEILTFAQYGSTLNIGYLFCVHPMKAIRLITDIIDPLCFNNVCMYAQALHTKLANLIDRELESL
jgi:hypothetical protein